MNTERFKYIGVGLGFLAIQVVLFRHLRIYHIEPDLVLIFLIWYISRKDRTSALFMAAGLGFFQDALLDLWGLNMFSKTLLTLIGYNFIPKNSEVRLLTGQVFITVLIASLVHNLIFLALNSIILNYSGELFFWRHWLGSGLYTAVVAGFIRLFRTK